MMRCVYRHCGGCTSCGRTDEPLTTLVPAKGPGRVRHVCPACYEDIAQTTWIVHREGSQL